MVALGWPPLQEEITMSIEQIANRLVELCRKGEYEQAQKEGSQGLGNAKGLAAIFEKGHQFNALVEAVHGGTVSEPVIAGNWFSVAATLDATMKGRGRVNMREICVYGVRDGKIFREQFFYDLG